MVRDSSNLISPEREIECFELWALFDICSLDSDYPRNFKKRDSPDWMSDEIGLEVSKSIPQERFQFDNIDLSRLTLKEIVGLSFDYDGHIGFKFVGGEHNGKVFLYYVLTREIVTYRGNGFKIIQYDNLPPEEKNAINNSVPIGTKSGDDRIDNPFEAFNYANLQFCNKIKKLNEKSYTACHKNHLYLHSGSSWIDTRGIHGFMCDLIKERGNWEKKFDVVFLYVWKCLLKFDLDEKRVTYFRACDNFDRRPFIENNCKNRLEGKFFMDIVGNVPNRCLERGVIEENAYFHL